MNQGAANGIPAFGGGFQALAFVARSHGVQTSAAQIAHQMAHGRIAPSGEDLARAAKLIGLKARVIRHPSAKRLRSIPVPAIIKLRDGTWAVFGGETTPGLFRVLDPAAKSTEKLPLEDVLKRLDREAVLIGKGLALATESLAFGIGLDGPVQRKRLMQARCKSIRKGIDTWPGQKTKCTN